MVFIDDDAWSEPDWLDRLLMPYNDGRVVAVGGAPLPEFESARPSWFPVEFDWVFGCAYDGLPQTRATQARLIGANMSVRRKALAAIDGFHSDNHDDMDMCHRLMHAFPGGLIVYEPRARVRHHVPTARTTWHYFWRRCFFVNKGKVEAFRQMEEAASLSADFGFVGRAMTHGVRAPWARPSEGMPQAWAGPEPSWRASPWRVRATWQGKAPCWLANDGSGDMRGMAGELGAACGCQNVSDDCRAVITGASAEVPTDVQGTGGGLA